MRGELQHVVLPHREVRGCPAAGPDLQLFSGLLKATGGKLNQKSMAPRLWPQVLSWVQLCLRLDGNFCFCVFILQLNLSSQRLPDIQVLVKNMTARLEPYQYLHDQGLYTALSLQRLANEISELETDVGTIHNQLGNSQTQKLTKEVQWTIRW